jgi:hypothetical protein
LSPFREKTFNDGAARPRASGNRSLAIVAGKNLQGRLPGHWRFSNVHHWIAIEFAVTRGRAIVIANRIDYGLVIEMPCISPGNVSVRSS